MSHEPAFRKSQDTPRGTTRIIGATAAGFQRRRRGNKKNPKLPNRHFYVDLNQEEQREEEVEELPGGSASAGNLRCFTSSQSDHRISAKLVFGGNRQTANDTTTSHDHVYLTVRDCGDMRFLPNHTRHISAASLNCRHLAPSSGQKSS